MLLSMYFEEKFIYDEIEGFKPLKVPDFLRILNEIKKKPLDRVLLVEMAGVKPASKTDFSQHYSQD